MSYIGENKNLLSDDPSSKQRNNWSIDSYKQEAAMIAVRMLSIDLSPVKELIDARKNQWKQIKKSPSRALNKCCVLMLSALLQGHIDHLFYAVARNHFDMSDDEVQTYRAAVGNWGNPNAENIERLFTRLGVIGILKQVNWSKSDGKTIAGKLRVLNEQRNKIAHGREPRGSLKLTDIEKTADFVETFSRELSAYLRRKFRRSLRTHG